MTPTAPNSIDRGDAEASITGPSVDAPDVTEPSAHEPGLATVTLGRADLVAATEREIAAHVAERAAAGEGGWVITVNLDILRRYYRDPAFADMADRSKFWTADGAPLVWACRIQGTPLPERGNGTNIMLKLCEEAGRRGQSIYLLGGNPGTAEKTAALLVERFPGLRIAGQECPPFGFDQDPEAVRAIGERVAAARPDVVFVALGCPKQERLIDAIREQCPTAWWLGIGVSFSFIAGEVGRAPAWMQRWGLEWAHRMVQEPGRLVRRYLIDDAPFGLWLLFRAVITRLSGRGGVA